MSTLSAVRFGAIYQLKGLDETKGKQMAEATVKAHGALGKGTAAWFQQPAAENTRMTDTFVLTFQDAADYLSLKQGVLAIFPESDADPLTARFRADALAGVNKGFIDGKKASITPIELTPADEGRLLFQA